jgi:AraC family transcriptional regulator
MKMFIKNMVCNRCIMVVEQEFEKAGIKPESVELGEVELKNELTEQQAQTIQKRLAELGFEVLDTKHQRQIEKVKSSLIEMVQSGEIEEHFSISDFISSKLNKEYSQVSRLFSEVEGTTIEQFYILQKIEKVKEWLVYDELSLSEIAWKLGYSSVAHLSAQFKKITGLTPSEFKKIGNSRRKPLDMVKKNK